LGLISRTKRFCAHKHLLLLKRSHGPNRTCLTLVRPVTPAKAGVQTRAMSAVHTLWIPVSTGMTSYRPLVSFTTDPVGEAVGRS
jgi:hypothetical protein